MIIFLKVPVFLTHGSKVINKQVYNNNVLSNTKPFSNPSAFLENPPSPEQFSLSSSQRLIPWSGKLKLPLKVDRNNCSIRFLEHMQVQIDLVFPRRGYLEMNSESPDGTVSKLLYPRGMDALTGFKKLSNWTVTSLHYWGENPVGEWNITIQNSKTQRNTRGGKLHRAVWYLRIQEYRQNQLALKN